MKTREAGRLTYARFTDPSNTLIRAEFKDYSNDAAVTVQHITFNPDDKYCSKILKEFSTEDLERNYVEFNKMELTRQNYFNKFVERFDEIIEYIDSGVTAADTKSSEMTLQSIKEIGNNAEAFFKLKLEIFELAEVKNSKNRTWKAKMRKATTTLELLALLYEVYSTLENEQGERQDETPAQETATLPDNAS